MKELLDELGMSRSLKRMAHEIIEKNKGCENVVLVGIKTRGEYIAKMIAAYIKDFEGIEVPLDSLDITSWRDDVSTKNEPHVLNVNVKDKIVILVDDVLFTGRTVRAAMEGILTYGRAAEIHLAVLVDRGHRQLPIRADYVGKNVPTSLQEAIEVHVEDIDGNNGVYITSKD